MGFVCTVFVNVAGKVDHSAVLSYPIKSKALALVVLPRDVLYCLVSNVQLF